MSITAEAIAMSTREPNEQEHLPKEEGGAIRASGRGHFSHVARTGLSALVIALLMLAAATTADASNVRRHDQTVRTEFVPPNHERAIFIDYAKPPAPPGKPVATADATDFHLLAGHPSWPAGSTIDYSVTTTGCSPDCGGAASSVSAAFDTWQVSGLTFTMTSTGATDRCGGTDSVTWAPIDGPGGVLASTSVCQTLGPNRQIVGFQTVFDSGDSWSVSAEGTNMFDIQATATHEEGHTIGLDHVHSPFDARLTMYPYITPGDIGFRTLGCGDRLGVNAIYGPSLDCSGVPLD
jgi:hypothetical protein